MLLPTSPWSMASATSTDVPAPMAAASTFDSPKPAKKRSRVTPSHAPSMRCSYSHGEASIVSSQLVTCSSVYHGQLAALNSATYCRHGEPCASTSSRNQSTGRPTGVIVNQQRPRRLMRRARVSMRM